MATSERPVKTVAVIGAGISGVCSAAHLLKQGLEVVLFERSSIAGGVWHFDQRAAPDPEYPNEKPSAGDYKRHVPTADCYLTPPRTPSVESLRHEGQSSSSQSNREPLEISHAPPGPCYAGLKNNVGLRLMKTSLSNWPIGLDEFVSQQYLEKYIQEIARTSGVNEIAHYNTRVEEVVKPAPGGLWAVRTTRLDASLDHDNLVEQKWQFDAVVVASGHYNMPRIPDIPGLKELKARFPARVMHSKRYRSPSPFKDKRLLLIGAGVSSLDIAKETAVLSKMVYQSSRGGVLDLPPEMLPENSRRVGEIKAFHLDKIPPTPSLDAIDCSLGHVELESGEKLHIDNVILGTGYITSYPYLPQYHNDEKRADQADDSILVTGEGDMVHHLHKDIFWMPDPTLAFIGVPYHIATFSLFDFQAQIVARVFAGLANLPPEAEMWEQYRGRLASRALGRDFHSLRGDGEELAYVADLVAWANKDADTTGAVPMKGHRGDFLIAHQEQRGRLKTLLGRRFERHKTT